MISAQETLARLKEGNQRFRSGVRSSAALWLNCDPLQMAAGQDPVAMVLGCADSRVPVEIIFDQGPGDLFVSRVAGNIVGPSELGTMEYALLELDIRLVLVLGHSRCGAVQATLADQSPGPERADDHLSGILDSVRPALVGLMNSDKREQPEELMEAAVRANVQQSIATLQSGSSVLRAALESDQVMVAGAVYQLETGEVEFLEPS